MSQIEDRVGGGQELMWGEGKTERGESSGERTSPRKPRRLCKQWILRRGRKWEQGSEGRREERTGALEVKEDPSKVSMGSCVQEESNMKHTHTQIGFDTSQLSHASEEKLETRIQSAETLRGCQYVLWADATSTFNTTKKRSCDEEPRSFLTQNESAA